MPSRTQHDSPKKNRFIGAVQAGKTVAAAAREHNIPQHTASDIWHKFRRTGSTHNLPRSGRPKVIIPRMSRNIIFEVKKSRHKPLTEVGQATISSVSASSVQKTIASVGLHRRKAQKVVYLTKTQKRAQKQWALRYKGWKERDWGTVIWSDECYVYLRDD
jgi:transposase-like protein